MMIEARRLAGDIIRLLTEIRDELRALRAQRETTTGGK
jgi:hypothetical protein